LLDQPEIYGLVLNPIKLAQWITRETINLLCPYLGYIITSEQSSH